MKPISYILIGVCIGILAYLLYTWAAVSRGRNKGVQVGSHVPQTKGDLNRDKKEELEDYISGPKKETEQEYVNRVIREAQNGERQLTMSRKGGVGIGKLPVSS
jgi:hypothetical protein